MSETTSGLEPVDYPNMRPGRIEPAPVLAEMRRDRPVSRVRLPYGADGWLVTRHADVRTVYSDPRFSRAAAITPDVPRASPFVPRPDSMLSMDPPEHTRLRGLMMKAFTARRIQLLRPGTERVTAELLDDIIAQGPPAELVSGLCLPLPVMVICELLGVPYTDRHLLNEWSTAFTSVTALSAEEVQNAYTSLREYVAGLVAQRRREPADDFLGALVEARDSEDRLSEDELVTMTVFLLVAGHETTATQLANSLYLLLDRPEELAKLRERPELTPTAVDELLRYIPIFASATLARVALEDVEIGGVLIRAGDAVLCSDAGANWDEEVFAEPERLDFTRSPNPHMAFGHGAHRCLGSQLARMELQVALRAVAGRFEEPRLAVAPEQVTWKSGKTTHGVAELPVAW